VAPYSVPHTGDKIMPSQRSAALDIRQIISIAPVPYFMTMVIRDDISGPGAGAGYSLARLPELMHRSIPPVEGG